MENSPLFTCNVDIREGRAKEEEEGKVDLAVASQWCWWRGRGKQTVVPGGREEKNSGCYCGFFFFMQVHKISLFSLFFLFSFLFSSLILVSSILSSFLYFFFVLLSSSLVSFFSFLFSSFYVPLLLLVKGVIYKGKRGREPPYLCAFSLNK